MKRFALLLPLLLLFCTSPTKASISLLQACNVSTAAVTSTTCVLNTQSLTNGTIIACGMMWGNNITGATFTVSDPTNGTYTAVSGTPRNDGLTSNSLYGSWAKNTSTASSLTVTLSVSGSGSHTIRAGCYEYNSTTGWQSSPLDTSNAASSSGTGTTGNPGNVTPSATGNLIFAAIQVSISITANSFTVSGTGMVREDAGGTAGSGWGSQTRAVGCDNTNSGNTATTCTFNWTTSADWASFIVVFKPNAAGSATCSNTIALTGVGCK